MISVKEFSTCSEPGFALGIQTPWGDDCGYEKYCLFHGKIWKWSLWLKVPEFFKPRKKWVDLSKESWATVGKDGRKGYWEHIMRDYGFSFTPDALHVRYGIQPGYWSARDPKNSDHSKVFWYPWKLTHVRHSILDLNQKIVYTSKEWDNLTKPKWNMKHPQAFHFIQDASCIAFFDYYDKYNDCTVTARAYVEEREWHMGLWKWMRLFTKNFEWGRFIRRELYVEFFEEVGPRKGSWKGGVMGCSLYIRPGETTHEAIERFKNEWDPKR